MFSDWWEEQIRLAVEKAKMETAEKILRKGHEYLMNSTDKAVAFSCFLGMIEAEFGVKIKE